MYFDRFDAKMRAKESLRANRPSPYLVTLVYLLLTTGLSWLIGRLIFNPSELILQYTQWGYSLEEILYYLQEEYAAQIGIALGVSLVFSFYQSVMSFGYASYALRLARNEQPGYQRLLDGFLMLGRVLWANLLMALLVLLWALPFLLAMWLLFLFENALSVFLAVAVYVATVVMLVLKLLSYSQTFYFMLDDPDCTALKAITRSKEVMRGHRGELFMLELSFFGWQILSALTLNLLSLWLLPYQGATEANFYDFLVSRPGEVPPQNEGGDYHYHMTDDSQPF